MSGQPTVLQVVILRDGLLVGTEVFVPGTYTVGSGDTVDLRLDDATVEAEHAVLYFQNGKVAIQDSSAVGVYVNGHRVTSCEVRSVDEVVVGPFSLKARVMAQRGAAKAAPPPEVAQLLGTPAPAKPAVPPSAKAPPPAAARPAPAPPPPAGGVRVLSGATAPTQRAPPPAANPAPPAGGATVLSARRLAAAPAPTSEPPQAPRAPHLRALTPLPLDDDDNTATVTRPALDEEVVRHAQQAVAQQKAAPAQPPAKTVAASPKRGGRTSDSEEVRTVTSFVEMPSVRIPTEGKGKPRLYFELYWGDVRKEVRSFSGAQAKNKKKGILAGPDEKAPLPLYGFSLPEDQYRIADAEGDAFRVYPPPSSVVEKLDKSGEFAPLRPQELEVEGSKRFVTLTPGRAARISEGELTLVVYAAKPLKAPFANPLKGMPWLSLFLLALFGTGMGVFLQLAPTQDDRADFQQKGLPPVAIRLIAPEPKKKEEAKQKLEELKEKAEAKAEKKEKVVHDKQAKKVVKEKIVATPPPAAAESKALKALAKLSAAGPASKDILAAVDKLGNGPGSKFVKDSNYKLSGLIGKAPIANAGIGTFGLGGGGGGGFGVKGAELLRGKGGGGIGALGAGGIGKGTVGGTVTRATARSISATGSIDREAVAKVVNSHLQEVRACYEKVLLKDPGLAGKVVLEWTISTSGHVVTAKTKTSTLRNAAVEGCILQNLKGWTFPPAKGGVVIVSYPFLFNSVGY